MKSRRSSRQRFDIWPGFVDALSGLLIIILFVSMVFMTSQFFLSEALSGRDKTIETLNRRVAELASLLALEKVQKDQAQTRLDQIARELRETIAARDKLRQQTTSLESIIAALRFDVDKMKAEQARLRAERDKLTEARKGLIAERDRLSTDKAELEKRRATLEAQIARLEDEKKALEKERSEMIRQLAQLAAARRELEKRTKSLEGDKAELEKRQALLDKTKTELEAERARLIEQIGRLARARDALEKRETVLEKDKAALEKDKAGLEKDKASLEADKAALQKDRDQLARDKADLEQQIASLSRLKAELERRIAELAKQFAALRGDRADLVKRNTDLEKDKAALEKDKAGVDMKLTEAERKLAEQKQLSDRALAEVALLNRQIAALRRQLASIQAALDASDAKVKEQTLKLTDLGRRLNAALASKVQELERYRSQFFGRLREVLGSRSDIKIVGDRFVFQSEVLFPSGSDTLEDGGRQQLRKLAGTLKEISEKIPTDIDWVLRVDGHTDVRPISNERFRSNWELSAARAIAVVQFLIDEGIPPNRLVAAGFGEFQPVDKGRNTEAYARNRRLELKITQR